MALERIRITYQDYLQLPETSRYEVLGGDLRMVPAPNEVHQKVTGEIYYALVTQVGRKGRGRVYFGPFDVILDEDSVVQPDVLVVLKPNLSIVSPEGIRGAPDLVVEVLSPGTAARDRGIKRRLYGGYGVKEYWIVDPDANTVEITVNRNGSMETRSLATAGNRMESELLPDLDLWVDQVFGSM